MNESKRNTWKWLWRMPISGRDRVLVNLANSAVRLASEFAEHRWQSGSHDKEAHKPPFRLPTRFAEVGSSEWDIKIVSNDKDAELRLATGSQEDRNPLRVSSRKKIQTQSSLLTWGRPTSWPNIAWRCQIGNIRTLLGYRLICVRSSRNESGRFRPTRIVVCRCSMSSLLNLPNLIHSA